MKLTSKLWYISFIADTSVVWSVKGMRVNKEMGFIEYFWGDVCMLQYTWVATMKIIYVWK